MTVTEITPRSARPRRALAPICAAIVAALAMVAGASAARADAEATGRLFAAVHASDLTAVQTSLAAGASLEATDRWGMTALELAVDKGYYHIAHYLTAARNFRATDGSRTGSARSDAAATAKAATTKGANGAGRRGPSARPERAPRAAAAPAPQPGAAPIPAWPSDRPNPFDPSEPAFGSAPLVVGETGAPPVEQATLDGGS